MKALIIGCGYVGSRVARLWHQQGIEVTVTTTTSSKQLRLQAIASKVLVLTGDDLNAVQAAVANQDLILLSLGAKERSDAGYQKAYLDSAQNIATAIKSSNSVKQLIYTSSYGILSNQSGDLVDESVLVNPDTTKGKIMHQTEKVLLGAENSDRSLHTCIFRLSGIYGEGRELIRIFQKRAGTTQPGAGADFTNWVHINDIVRAINHAQKLQLQGIFNLTSDEVLTTKEFFQRLFQTHNLEPINWDSSKPSARPYNMKLSNQKLKNSGFELVHPNIEF